MSLPNLTEHQTDDIAFAAFLRVKGYRLCRVEKLQPNRTDSKRLFIFEAPSDALQALKLDYVNSELLRFHNELLGLKKL
jgi:hypothetical protein